MEEIPFTENHSTTYISVFLGQEVPTNALKAFTSFSSLSLRHAFEYIFFLYPFPWSKLIFTLSAYEIGRVSSKKMWNYKVSKINTSYFLLLIPLIIHYQLNDVLLFPLSFLKMLLQKKTHGYIYLASPQWVLSKFNFLLTSGGMHSLQK